MATLGKKVYYDLQTGNVIIETSMMNGDVQQTTKEQDFKLYSKLKDKDPESIGVIQLDPYQYQEEFNTSNSVKVNLETLSLEFSYPDPQNPIQAPVYQKPLTDEIAELKQAIAELSILVAGGGV